MVVKRLVVMFLVMFAFSVYLGSEKEVVVGSADELKGIELVVLLKAASQSNLNQSFGSKDGAKMKCIPAGTSTPVFHMGRTGVTAGQFKKFLQESEYSDEHPMIFVNLV